MSRTGGSIEIYKDGQKIDPLQLLADAAAEN
jgi:hypothetical protein